MILRTFKIITIIVVTTILITSCGDPVVTIEDAAYEPKIVVNAFIYPEEPVEDIYITRNFMLNTPIDTNILFLTPMVNNAVVSINDVPLQFDDIKKTYYSNEINIDYGTAYRINVSAQIDGVQLNTESFTTTPNRGFDILVNDLGVAEYIRDEVSIDFMPSPGTSFYLFSYVPDSASYDNYINDNPFLPNLEREYFEENYFRFLFQFNLLLNINSYSTEPIQMQVSGFDTWFYTSYRVIVYAGDENFKDYFLTAARVQQFDGNFIEPEFHLTGEGIGVFGSAIRDTVTFTIVP